MAINVFIDGKEGTTGLKIEERLAGRTDIAVMKVDDTLRKDAYYRAGMINSSDITFLCLPDAAAIEAVGLCKNEKTVIIDASTAHRTAPGWAYGLPELSGAHREAVRASKRIAVPGCYPTGFTLLVYPLVEAGIIPIDYPLVCQALSGYSGAGKSGIAAYEAPDRDRLLDSPRPYGFNLAHKHLPEMKHISGLSEAPIFTPIVDDYYSGMVVTVPLYNRLLRGAPPAQKLAAALAERYKKQPLITVHPHDAKEPEIDKMFANKLANRNDLEIFIFGNAEQTVLCARFDNLGKGASGAAVQCMNIVLGIDETTGLV